MSDRTAATPRAPMGSPGQPVSPHLQIWRWTATLICSITHRATGMALYSGTVLLTIWLAAAATGEEAFAAVSAVYTSPVGLLILFGYTWALFFHLLNGIRHLVWDAGYAFSIPAARTGAWIVLIGSAVLTVIVWAVALLTGGN